MIFNLQPLKRKYLLLISLFLSTRLLIAQTEFRPGYIISNTNDTIFGEIDFRNDKFMSEKCRFKSGNGEIVFYTPEELLGYRIYNSKYFVSKRINGKNVFLEFLINGQINIYYKYDETGLHYYLEKVGEKIIEMPYKEQYVVQNGIRNLIKSTDHIGLLTYYMQDAPELKSSIYKIDKPEHTNLIKLAEDYHNIVCKDHECIIYEKKMFSFKLEIEVQGGMNLLTGSGTIHQLLSSNHIRSWNSQATGIIFHISSPMLSEKYILRTGIQYSKHVDYVSHENISSFGFYTIPVGIEYLRPRGFIRPTYALGINIVTIPHHSFVEFSLGAGLNFKITNWVLLGVNYNIDIYPIDRHSFLAGLRFKL